MKLIHSLCSFFLFLALVVFTADGRAFGIALADDPVACKVAPIVKSPKDKVGDGTPVFTWQALAGCTNYQFYLSNDVAILSITWVTALQAGGLGGGGNCTFIPEQVLGEGDYNWWVRGWQPGKGTSKWSSGTRFSIDMDVCAKQPEPVAPIEVVQSAPEFQWRGVYGCEWYQLSASGPHGNVLGAWVNGDEIGCVFDTVCSFAPGVTLQPGAYLWWIRGWSRGTRIGRWTSGTSFTVEEYSKGSRWDRI